MKRIAMVTGGCGFLGQHVVRRLLAEGTEVTVLDRRAHGPVFDLPEEVGVIYEDVVHWLDANTRWTEIWHLACPASPIEYRRDPIGTLRTCAEGTRAVLDVAEHSGARVLIASSSEVYGDPFRSPQDESFRGWVDCTGPRSMYDEGKRYAEALAVAYHRLDVDVRIARIFNTYGPGMRLDDGRMIPEFLLGAIRTGALRVHGDGQQSRSLCYVDDLVDGLFALMRAAPQPELVARPINLGDTDERSVLDWARFVARMATDRGLPCRVEVIPQPDPHDPRRRRPDLRRAQTYLGYAPKVPASAGLARTFDDVQARLAAGT